MQQYSKLVASTQSPRYPRPPTLGYYCYLLPHAGVSVCVYVFPCLCLSVSVCGCTCVRVCVSSPLVLLPRAPPRYQHQITRCQYTTEFNCTMDQSFPPLLSSPFFSPTLCDDTAHTTKMCRIYGQPLWIVQPISAIEPYISSKEPYACEKEPQHFRKRAIYI